jgi:hypothetical protein
VSGGQPIDLYGEWNGRALLPLGTLAEGRSTPSSARSRRHEGADRGGAGRARARRDAARRPRRAGRRLLSRASDLAAERAFLLRLGVHAVRARAGLTPARDGERPEAAPPESRPPCSPSLAAIVADACAGRNRRSSSRR